MRNKIVVENKLERLIAEIKLIGYHIRRNETDTAYLKVGEVIEKIEDIIHFLEPKLKTNDTNSRTDTKELGQTP